MRHVLPICMSLLALMAGPAFAHHPTGGTAPGTVLEGLMSGLGHPIIEAEHLGFLLGAAALVAVARLSTRAALGLLAAFALAGAVGTSLRAAGFGHALTEPLITGSVLVVALGLWLNKMPAAFLALPLAVLAGLAHGQAYGEAVIGSEPTPIHAYLLGLALIQALLTTATYLALRRLAARGPQHLAAGLRVAGTLLATGALWSMWAGA